VWLLLCLVLGPLMVMVMRTNAAKLYKLDLK
jgi:hypothetical protein